MATWLTEAGHDAVHVSHLGLDRAADVEIVRRAKQEARTIIAADLDYARLHARGRETEPSLILSREGNWSDADVISRMRQILNALKAAEIEHSILVIEQGRVRRRRLPM